MAGQVRVRFAPSPTGYLHVGGARTALFNFLYARHNGGAFILRIEDTDRKRFQPDALNEIYESLKWLGLEWDEGPNRGGAYGPYVQSERIEIYRRHIQTLLDSGHAYRCFCSPERLERLRQEQQEAKMKEGSGYDRLCRTLTDAAAGEKMAAGIPFVVRLKVPAAETISFEDRIRGAIAVSSDLQDDIVLLKSDGYPTYHLANVVDDHLMAVTHVLRGDEWIASTPRHILLYRAFGWQPPEFAHMPVILSPDGGKLSKRKGAASVMDYKAAGFLPEALFNFLALLGWNPGDDREILDRGQMVSLFDFDRISPKAAVFDEKKLDWMNGEYLRMESRFDAVLDIVSGKWEAAGCDAPREYGRKVLSLFLPRAKRIPEIVANSAYFFRDPEEFEKEKAEKYFTPPYGQALQAVAAGLADLGGAGGADFTPERIEAVLRGVAEERGVKLGEVVHPIRLALSGVSAGPGLFEMMAVLGREAVLRRLRKAIDRSGG